MPAMPEKRPAGFLPLGIFFFFGSVMASFAAFTLFKPGTILDRAWALNKSAHAELMAIGPIMSGPFAVLAVALLVTGVGWRKRRYWGWKLGVTVIAINLVGDVVNTVRGERMKGAIGITIAGLLLVYMTRREMQDYFRVQSPQNRLPDC